MSLGLGIGLSLGGGRSRVLRALDFTTAPRANNAFTLPAWLALTCATAGRTGRSGPGSLTEGHGANAAIAHSVDGTTFGLLMHAARTNLAQRSRDLGDAYWTPNTGVTVSSNSADTLDPYGTNTAEKIVYDGSGAAGGFRHYHSPILNPSANGVSYCASAWWAQLSGGRSVKLLNNVSATITNWTPTAVWSRAENVGTGDGTTVLQHVLYSPTGVNDAFTIYGSSYQVEVGKYPGLPIPTAGATAARGADVLSLQNPATVAPGGFFDVRIAFAPHFTQAEQDNDLDLLYFGANDRVYLKASDHKVYHRVGGADVASSALTWSRDQALTIRAVHKASGRILTVTGATTGDGTASAAAAAAITLPGTAYLMGSNTGPTECADLRSVAFVM